MGDSFTSPTLPPHTLSPPSLKTRVGGLVLPTPALCLGFRAMGGLVHVPHITPTHETRVRGPPALCLVFRATEGSFTCTSPSLSRNVSRRACPAHTCPVSRVLSNGGPIHVPHIPTLHETQVEFSLKFSIHPLYVVRNIYFCCSDWS